uniref:Uncharacterized protein n=1 Tax=Panagrolaimus davidi TaxID=227884 RepID=A0A914PFW6_9BILA
MLVFNTFSFLFILALIAKIDAGISIFIDLQCVELNATLSTFDTFNTAKSAMRKCSELASCIGVKKILENEYLLLHTLTGYVINETCKDYYLWDVTGGQTFPNQPTPIEPAVLFQIYKDGSECPRGFNVDGTLCRRYAVTSEFCYSYLSYMAPQHDGTSCWVVQRQTILDSWA